MSLTRKMLKAMGIEEDKIDQIIEAHSETVEALKADRDKLKKDADKIEDLQNQLDDANKKLSKAVTKEDYDKLKNEYDNFKSDTNSKDALRAKQAAYRELAKTAGLSEKGIEKAVKYANFDEVELDNDGKIADAEKHSEAIKNEWSDYVETTTIKGANTATPPANSDNTKLTKADIYKKDDKGRYVMSAAERQKALAENPDIMN